MIINKEMADKRETRQKKAMETAMNRMNSFFNAESLHEKLKKDNPRIGIATVYRFLKEMLKKREIHTFTCDKKRFYSKKWANHAHFICEICGLKKHIEIDKIDFMKKLTDEDVCHVQIEINGVCKSCKLNWSS